MLHLKAHLKFHFNGHLKLHKELMVHLSVHLKVHLGYIKAGPIEALSKLHKDIQAGAVEFALKVTLEVALKGALEEVSLQLHLYFTCWCTY